MKMKMKIKITVNPYERTIPRFIYFKTNELVICCVKSEAFKKIFFLRGINYNYTKPLNDRRTFTILDIHNKDHFLNVFNIIQETYKNTNWWYSVIERGGLPGDDFFDTDRFVLLVTQPAFPTGDILADSD